MVPRQHAGRAGCDPRTTVVAPNRTLAAAVPTPSRPKIYTIASDRPFLTTLAAGLVEMSGDDPLRLMRVRVLLPTRRAVRALREAFLRVTTAGEGGGPLLLPRMQPIGDLDSDELALSAGV